MDSNSNDLPDSLPDGPDDDALTDDDALVDTDDATSADAVAAERPGEATRQAGTGEMVLTDEEKADELGQGSPSTGVSAGGETAAGSGYVGTMGGVLSGGQDYTAANLGGTGVPRDDDGHDRGIVASGEEDDEEAD